MEEYFNNFLHKKEFFPAIDSIPVEEKTLAYFQNKLPNRLLKYWREYGFSGYGEGLFWMVNPDDYQDIANKWLQKTPLWGRENFYVVARTAFGELYIRGD